MTLRRAYRRRTCPELLVRPPSLKTGCVNRSVVAIGTTRPVPSRAERDQVVVVEGDAVDAQLGQALHGLHGVHPGPGHFMPDSGTLPGMKTTLPEELDGTLVAAVDDSAASREALRYAAVLAVESRRPLHVVTIWNFVMGPAPAERDRDVPPCEARWQAEAERRLAAVLAEELGGQEGLDVRGWALHGNTVPTLLEVTRRARHLVVGSRGRGGFAGLLLGSTTDQLLHHACCPVTVVRQGCTENAS